MNILLFGLYLLTRFFALIDFPVFNDESIYIDWGYRATHIDGLAFYSLYDAKQPLILWLFGISQNFFSDFLLASRLVSVCIGFLSVFGINKLSQLFFGKKKIYIAPFLYVITPIFLFFDRQALMESAVFCVGIYIYLLYRKMVISKGYVYAVIFGLLIGIAFYIKSTVIIYVLALFPLLVHKMRQNTDTGNLNLFIKLFLSLFFSLTVLVPLLDQDMFWKTMSSNSRFILTFSELLTFPFAIWMKNLYSFFIIVTIYITPFIIPMLLIVFFQKKKIENNLQQFFLYCFSIIVLAIFFTRGLSVRYTMPLLFVFPIFLEYFISEYQFKKRLFNTLYFLCFAPQFLLSFLLLTNYELYFKYLNKFTIYSQYEEYMVSWTSGLAVQQAVEYIKKHELQDDQHLNIGVRTDAGNPENALFYSFYGNKNVSVSYFDNASINNLSDYNCISSKNKFIFVSRDNNFGGTQKFWQEKIRFYNYESKNFVAIHVPKENCVGNKLEIK